MMLFSVCHYVNVHVFNIEVDLIHTAIGVIAVVTLFCGRFASWKRSILDLLHCCLLHCSNLTIYFV